MSATNTGIAWTCGYCGRPIGGPMTCLGGQMYHPECTRGPSHNEQTFTPCVIDDPEKTELRRRIEALERRVHQLECSPMSGGILGPRSGNVLCNGVPVQEG